MIAQKPGESPRIDMSVSGGKKVRSWEDWKMLCLSSQSDDSGFHGEKMVPVFGFGCLDLEAKLPPKYGCSSSFRRP